MNEISDTWFQVFRSNYSASKIAPVAIERHTETSVWVGGRRYSQTTDYRCYRPTWEAAHALLVADAKQNVQSIRVQLERANGLLGNVKGMKNPAATKESA